MWRGGGRGIPLHGGRGAGKGAVVGHQGGMEGIHRLQALHVPAEDVSAQGQVSMCQRMAQGKLRQEVGAVVKVRPELLGKTRKFVGQGRHLPVSVKSVDGESVAAAAY